MKKKWIVLAALIVIVIVSYFWLGKALAIRQAETYKCPVGVFSVQVSTPAVHTLTGAKYTFNDGCLSPGWERLN